MARKTQFLGAEFSDRFRESYAALSHDRQSAVDRVILALMKQLVTAGMRVKPILPEKYYHEARMNEGDRLIHRIADGRVWVVEVVNHNDMGRYGKAQSSRR